MSKVWRMEKPCENCPFSESEEGKTLRATLRADRLRTLERDLLAGRHFTCHKTIYCANPTNKVCAGAIAWQAERGIIADLVQIMERLDRITGGRHA